MSIVGALLGGDYISLVKKFILKVFIHEESKYGLKPGNIAIIIRRKGESGDLEIMNYSQVKGEVLRTLPDEEVQKILLEE